VAPFGVMIRGLSEKIETSLTGSLKRNDIKITFGFESAAVSEWGRPPGALLRGAAGDGACLEDAHVPELVAGRLGLAGEKKGIGEGWTQGSIGSF